MKMRLILKWLLLSIALLIVAAVPTQSQTGGTIATDKSTYNSGDTITIAYYISTDCYVNFWITTPYGEVLDKVIDRWEHAGTHTWSPNARVVNPGVYTIQLMTKTDYFGQYFPTASCQFTVTNQPSNSQSNPQFRVTSGMYSETSNLDQAVKSEFGNDYHIADWNDIKAYSSDIQSWANSIGMLHGDYYFVTWNGQGFWNGGNRHYFITRFDGTVDSNYLVHDQIGGNIITLGSWYGIQERILAVRNTNQPQSQPQQPPVQPSIPCQTGCSYNPTLGKCDCSSQGSQTQPMDQFVQMYKSCAAQGKVYTMTGQCITMDQYKQMAQPCVAQGKADLCGQCITVEQFMQLAQNCAASGGTLYCMNCVSPSGKIIGLM